LVALSEEQKESIENNLILLKKHGLDFKTLLAEALSQEVPKNENVDMDAMLYQEGFRDYSDYQWGIDFHEASLDHKQNMLLQAPSEIIKVQAARMLVRNFDFPMGSSVYEMAQLHHRGCDHKGNYNPDSLDVLKRIEQLIKGELSDKQAALMHEYEKKLSMGV